MNRRTIERRRVLLLTAFCLTVLLPPTIADGGSTADLDKDEVRAALRQMRKETLAELYRHEPKAQVAIRGSAGYAVFESAGAHVLFLGGGGGRGIVRDNLTGKETFMRTGVVRAGLGVGFEDVRTVLVFKKRETLPTSWTWAGPSAAMPRRSSRPRGRVAGAVIWRPSRVSSSTRSPKQALWPAAA